MWVIVGLLVLAAAAYAAATYFRWPLFKAAIGAQRGKAKLTEKRITVDDDTIVYLDGGDSDAAPLVLLHGFGANKDNWIQIAPLLAPHFRLIIPDLAGFGDSSRDTSKSYSPEAQLARLRAFVRQLGIKSIHIGGNSLGGFLAGLYAARFADEVDSAWLLAPAGVEGAQDSEFFKLVENGDNALLVNDRSDFDRLIDMCFSVTPYVPKPFRACLFERSVEERDFNAKIFEDLVANPMVLENEMRDCSVKTQIVWGDEDRILHVSGAPLLASALTTVDTVVMPAMGHCPMLERPQESADLFLKFHGLG